MRSFVFSVFFRGFRPLRGLFAGLLLWGVGTLPTACEAIRQVPYFQDADSLSTLRLPPVPPVLLAPGDQLSIVVHSRDAELSKVFNLVQGAATGLARESCYTVDARGCIRFPVLGDLPVAGMDRAQLALYLRNRLLQEDLLVDPVVVVELRNLSYAVLGQVGAPGRYPLDRDRLTAVEALARAGDLRVDGRRTGVLLLREEGDRQQVYRLNLNSLQELQASPAYYLRQNDVLYVPPLFKARLGASQNGGALANLMTWTSLLSFVMGAVLWIRGS